ncbi:MAG: YihY/virulence factor BrkB family protein [Alphaproteobacteria bacterium]
MTTGASEPADSAALGRGRSSQTPAAIPASGWRDILARTFRAISKDYVSLVAAGMAFYTMLAIFPGLTALASLYGIFADPADMQAHLQTMAGVMPAGAMSIIDGLMDRLAQEERQSLGLSALFSLALAIWGSTKGVKAFIAAMNIAYEEEEKRGFLALNLTALALTGFLVVLALLSLLTVLVVPAALELLPVPARTDELMTILRWPAIALIFMFMLAVLYRYTPSRSDAKWAWVSTGSIVAVVLWLVASMAFSIYVRNFANYDESYGSVGAVVALLMWLWLSAYVMVMGAELNAEAERQTRRDTTVNPERPMGERGAHAADTLGKSRN